MYRIACSVAVKLFPHSFCCNCLDFRWKRLPQNEQKCLYFLFKTAGSSMTCSVRKRTTCWESWMWKWRTETVTGLEGCSLALWSEEGRVRWVLQVSGTKARRLFHHRKQEWFTVFVCVCACVGRENADIQWYVSAVVLLSNTGPVTGEGHSVCVVSLH